MTLEIRLAGPPGTGKTRTLAHQVELAARKYGPSQILVSSFTTAASREIASRIDLPDDRVATLHAHAFRALGRPPIAEGLAKDWNSRIGTMPAWRIGRRGASKIDDPLGEDDPRDSEGDALLARYNLHRSKQLSRALLPDDVLAFANEWDAWKDEAGCLDFTDLIARALEHVDIAPGDPMVGFFDEVQDWSPLELALVRKWGAHMGAGFMLAGDPDQTLYQFKGASAASFHNPPLPPERYWTLAQSYRVPRAVHATAMAWIERCNERVPVPYHPRAGAEGLVTFGNDGGYVGAGWSTPGPLIERALEDVKQTGRTQMILASCAYLLDPTCRELRRRGVPFWNPYRVAQGAWNPLRGGSERMVDFLRGPRPELLGDVAERRRWTWRECWRWVEPLQAAQVFRRGPGRGKQMIEGYGTAKDTEDDLVDNEALRTLGFEAAAWNQLMDALDSACPWTFLERHLLTSWEQRMAYAFAIANGAGPASMREKPKVIVGTVHSVKGGEAQRVTLFPDLSPAGWSEWIGGGDSEDSVRRTFYVGMTRASEELFLAGAAQPQAVAWHR